MLLSDGRSLLPKPKAHHLELNIKCDNALDEDDTALGRLIFVYQPVLDLLIVSQFFQVSFLIVPLEQSQNL